MAEKKGRKVICTSFAEGKKHDFKLFEQSKIQLTENIKCEADSGYQGISELHTNSEIPKKSSKKNPLTKEEKKKNHKLSSSRVLVENIIRELKIFRIIAEKYRNRRRRFGLRFNLIAAFYNQNLNYK